MGSGPRAGIGEIFLPELQKGSSIMPGKVNPVIPEVVLQVAAQVIGNDTAITVGGMQGQFELNVRIPLIARNLLQSIHLLSTASAAFAEKCVDGIEANKEGTKRSAESTLAVATALNEHIGYDKGAAIVKKAVGVRAHRCATSRSRRASTPSSTTAIDRTCARSPRGNQATTDGGSRRPRRRNAATATRARRPAWASAAAVGEQALLVDPAHEPDGRAPARRIEPPANDGREREVLEVPDELAVEPRASPRRCGCGG